VVNCGIGEASQNAKTLESTIRDIALITGQKAVVTRSRKAIAGFKLRQGVPVGVCLTLRGEVLPPASSLQNLIAFSNSCPIIQH
jgi:large subunit ribosomal protein L5